MTAVFTDNNTGITLGTDLFTWQSPNVVVIKSSHKNEIGYHSVNIALKLKSNPGAESRSHNVNVNVVESPYTEKEVIT